MAFHPDKCQVLTISRKKTTIKHDYTLNNHILQQVISAKYLGLTINHNLNWGEHISNITNKATRNLNFIRRNLNISSTTIKETAYLSLVRPGVEYSAVVWDPYEKTNIEQIDKKIQRRGARFVKNNYRNRSSVTHMINDLQWPSLKERRRNNKTHSRLQNSK